MRDRLLGFGIVLIVLIVGCLGGGGGGGGGGGNQLAPIIPPVPDVLLVRMITPENNSNHVAGRNIVLSAVAVLPIGSTDAVQKVEFYQGPTRLGEAIRPPFTYIWKNVPAGAYELFARGFTLAGSATDSPRIVVRVGDGSQQEPVIAITQPASGATYAMTDTVPIVASASRSGGTITLVEFLANGIGLGSATVAPYTYDWVNPPLGSYLLTARAIDNYGLVKTSDPIPLTIATFVNRLPVVAFLRPPAGTQFPPGSNITLAVSANDSDGRVVKVDFFADSLFLGAATSTPFTIVWQNALAGYYRVSARATDNYGGVSVPASIPLMVGQADFVFATPANNSVASKGALVTLSVDLTQIASPVQRVEYYRDFTEKIGESAILPAFPFAWVPPSLGTYILTARAYEYGGRVRDSGVIFVSVADTPQVRIASPTQFTVLPAGANVTIVVSASALPGSVVQVDLYRNGIHLAKLVPPNLTTYVWENAPAGRYALTASATDNNNLVGQSASVTVVLNQLPTVEIASPPNGLNANPGTSLLIQALATDTDGTIREVRFYRGSSLLGIVSQTPYNYLWASLPSGTQDLTAVAVDNYGFLATSSIVRIGVGGPAVAIASPPDNPAVVSLPPGSLGSANLTLVANAADGLYGITSIRMFVNGVQIGSAAASPLSVDWVPPAWGTYTLTASATNSRGVLGESIPSHLTINDIPLVIIASPAMSIAVNKGALVRDFRVAVTNSVGNLTSITAYGNGGLLAPATTTNPLVFSSFFPTPGVYTLSASATDSLGARGVTTSGPTVTVYDVPTVALTSPTGGTVFTGPPPPTNIPLTAEASLSDGTVTGVQFFANGLSVGTVLSPPYSLSWTPPGYAVYSLTASATDNRGGIGTSTPVTVTVNDRPTIAIASPVQDLFIRRYGTVSDITLVATNTVGTILSMELYLNGVLEAPGQTANPLRLSKTFTVPGIFYLTASVTDSLGATGSYNPGPLRITVIDTPTPATMPTLLINGGDPSTAQATVTLNISGPGQVAMRISNDLNFAGAPDEVPPVPPNTRSWVLPMSPGLKTVYVRFEDLAGNYTLVSDSIEVVGPTDASLTTDDPDPLATNVVNLKPFANGATEMLITESYGNLTSGIGWAPFQYATTSTLLPFSGPHTIYAKYRNAGRIETGILNLRVTVASAPAPATPTILVNLGDQITETATVSVTLFPGIYTYYTLSTTGAFSSSEAAISTLPLGPLGYPVINNVLLKPQAGIQTVWVRFRNGATLHTATDTIEVVAPTGAALTTDDAQPLATTLVNLKPFAVGATQMLITESYGDLTSGLGWQPFVYATQATLLPFSGSHTIYAKYRNAGMVETGVVNLVVTVASPPVPATPTILVNMGDLLTDTATVTVTLFPGSFTHCTVSTTPAFTGPEVQISSLPTNSGGHPIIPNLVFDRTAGVKTAWVRFRWGSTYHTATDSIEVVGPTNAALTTNDSLPLTSYQVNLQPFANGATEMLITENYADLASSPGNWATFSYAVSPFYLTYAQGAHTIYAKYRNAGGVETATLSLNVSVAVPPPASPTIIINGGDPSTVRSEVLLEPKNVGAYTKMAWSEDGNFTGVPYYDSLPTGYQFVNREAGTKTIYVRFKHASTQEIWQTSDTITFVGPASTSISTLDTQPLNSLKVNLTLSAQNATKMLLTEDVAKLSSYTEGDWRPYSPAYVYELTPGGGPHTVYVKFRNSDDIPRWVETPAQSLALDLRNTPPVGNSAVFRTGTQDTSPTVSSIGNASLPVYLHFNLTDPATKYVYWQMAKGTEVPTTFAGFATPPVPVQTYAKANFPVPPGDDVVGDFNLYLKFADGVGNTTPLTSVPLEVLGPDLVISPSNPGPFTSGQTQQFSATLKNVTGTVLWSLEVPPGKDVGVINQTTGLFTASSTITAPAVATVVAQLQEDASLIRKVAISLTTQVEVRPETRNTTLPLGRVKQLGVTFLNSTGSGTVEWNPVGAGGFTATISAAVADGSNMVATITATAPVALPLPSQNPIVLTIRASPPNEAKTSTIEYTITEGESISISPASVSLRLRTGRLNLTAAPTVATDVTWITSQGYFLDPGPVLMATTTTTPHVMTYYATSTAGVTSDFVKAYFMDGTNPREAICNISLTPAVTLVVDPMKYEDVSVAGTAQYRFRTQVASYATTSQVLWEFRCASTSEPGWAWTQIDTDEGAGATEAGRLDSSGNDALYRAPADFVATSVIEIRATSKDDGWASAVARVYLIPPVAVRIGQEIPPATFTDLTGQTLSALLEVDSKRFIAAVSNATDTTVKWYVNNIQGGNSSVGTIDADGLYTAPAALPSPSIVPIKAVANADPTKSASLYLQLAPFWQKRATGMQKNNGADMQITALLVDPIWPYPTTAASEPYRLFAGTRDNGVWMAYVDSVPATFAPDITWLATNHANRDNIGLDPFKVNGLAINRSNHDVAAATDDGLYILEWDESAASYSQVTPVALFSGVQVKSVAWDSGDPNYLYAAVVTPVGNGIQRVRFTDATMADPTYVPSANPVLTTFIRLGSYLTTEERDVEYPNPATPTEPIKVKETHYYPTVSLFDTPITKIALDPPQVLYLGSDDGNFGRINSIRDFQSPLVLVTTTRWTFATGQATHTSIFPILNISPPQPTPLVQNMGVITDVSIDTFSPWTLLISSSQGLYRSINYGATVNQLANSINTRATLIDPTNGTFFFYGCEDGLYRSKNAGTTWTQISSGLGGQRTIGAFTQSLGPPGSKRRIWVGTTGGVYMDGRSLDLE